MSGLAAAAGPVFSSLYNGGNLLAGDSSRGRGRAFGPGVKGMAVFESITVRILVEVVLLLGLVWIWSFFYKRSFERPGPEPPDEPD